MSTSALLELVALRSRARARAVHECSPKLRSRVCSTRAIRIGVVAHIFVVVTFEYMMEQKREIEQKRENYVFT